MIKTKNVETSIHVLFAVNKASLTPEASPANANEKNTPIDKICDYIKMLADAVHE